MAKKFKTFPAKAIIAITSVTSAFMFSVYAKDDGISDVTEIDVVLPPGVFMVYTAVITEEWYKRHKNHSNIKIGNYEVELNKYYQKHGKA